MWLEGTLTPFREVLKLGQFHKNSAFLLTLYFFLAMASVSIVKSVQNAVYLGNVGFDWRLPALYLALTLISGPIVLLYRYLSGYRTPLLIATATLFSLAVGLGCFWTILGAPETAAWSFPAFYLWGAIFTVLVPTQGWIFSYYLFTPRVARKVFILLGAGGILGGLCGGYYTYLTADLFGFKGLLLQTGGLLFILEAVLGGLFWLNRGHSGDRVSRESVDRHHRSAPMRSARRSPLLIRLAALVLLTGICTTLIDLQYKWALVFEYPGSVDHISRFFGGLLGTTYLISALIQLFGAGWVLRKFGLGTALMLLPAALLATSLGVVAAAAFWSIVAARGTAGSLRTSIEQTAVELLYVPISERHRVSVKNFMELVVFRLGDGLGAAFFLLAVSWPLLTIRLTAALVVGATVIWLFAVRAISEQYSKMLRRRLERMDSKPFAPSAATERETTESVLVSSLSHPDPRVVLCALQQLRHRAEALALSDLGTVELTPEAFSMDISGVYAQRAAFPRWIRAVHHLVDHPDPEVGALALHLMISHDVQGFRHALHRRLQSTRGPSRRDLIFLRKYADDLPDVIDPDRVIRWCRGASSSQAAELARLVGTVQDPSFPPILREWLNHDSKQVRLASIGALGEYADPQDFSLLMRYLEGHWSRPSARRALARHGEAVVERLRCLIHEPSIDSQIKREIPAVLAQINTQPAHTALISSLYSHDAVVAHRALQELNRIRVGRDHLFYREETFLPLLQIWACEYYGLLNIDLLLDPSPRPEYRLLRKALDERLSWGLEKIFRALGLFLPQGDAYFSYLGFTSERQELREYAVELIDTRIKGELRQTLMPLFSESHPLDVVRRGREIFKLPSAPATALAETFFKADPWLKCCTIGVVVAERMETLKDCIRQACDDINPLVRETARWALLRWDGTPASERRV
ncbi:MAG: Npt1/Npt2 family nucleotide transporter [Acidobacteriota bacterium]